MRISAAGVLVGLLLSVYPAFAETHSNFDKQYDLATLKTFDFKEQRRISRDPIADNQIWANDIRSAITVDLTSHGMKKDGAEAPDFLVAFYVGLKERYDVRYLGYGMPLLGPRYRGFHAGWPNDFDAWAVPFTESTLIVDIIDARTNQLVWRGYNEDPINLGKADKDFQHAVSDVLKRFYSDSRKTLPNSH